MILLDTHALVWYRAGARLRKGAMEAIAGSSKRGQIAVSSISAWEIGMLSARGRLDLGMPVADYMRELFRRSDVHEVPVTVPIAVRAAELSETFGGDPADQILLATAIELDCPIVTRDRRIVEFAKHSAGTVSAIAC
ncbi:MAG TPA: type II toxin-antitoxin system VapC family toxin [Candidatus Tumulicola sp.]|nr:type II toxin-antitoxin system VapC family toxin [Candidatus Tumulicola sp.]